MTPEHQQAERGAFETWAISQGWKKPLHLHRSVVDGRYAWQALNIAWDVWQAALEWKAGERPDVVPPGMVLVPIEPTEEMHAAAVRTIVRCNGNADFPPRVWRAMVAASQDSAKEPQ